MGMFTRTLEIEPFGKLTAEGKSKIWETTLDIPCLGHGFFVRIWGTAFGPTEEQTAAFSQLMRNAQAIRQQSAPRIFAYVQACGIVAAGACLNPENIWNYLKPCFIEIHATQEYAAWSGNPGKIAISIGYETPWEQEHFLQIGTLDGKLDEIYSE